MNIFICGLGLIGGSLAKAISARTPHTVVGYNRTKSVSEEALHVGAIAKAGEPKDLADCDIVIMGLYPKATIDFVKENLHYFKDGAILVETCGIKTEVCEALGALTKDTSVRFIGGHPMAGIERSGFAYTFPELFDGASMILCPEYCSDESAVETVSALCREIGFGRITISTAEHHDKVIAFTSQLAHVVSSAYVHGEYATQHKGFSAGSFRDLTRVARLNADMWTELFYENTENLSAVIGELIENLQKYKTALDTNDREGMHKLLADGNERKIQSENLGKDPAPCKPSM